MDYCIVAARCKEDVNWLKEFIPNVCIMNKGSRETIPKELLPYTRDIKNIGLDQYAHLQYIIQCYDNLPSLILFTQAGLHDHHDVHEREMRQNRAKVCDTFDPYVKTISTQQFARELISQAYMNGYSYNASCYMFPNGSYCANPYFKVDAPDELTTDLNFGEWFKTNIDPRMPSDKEFVWFKNAIFAVQKQYILTRPRAFYESISAQIKRPRQDVLHYIERSWYYMFNMERDLNQTALTIIQKNIHIFNTLDKLVIQSGQGWVEGSLFFPGFRDMSYTDKFVHKQINLFNLAKKAKNILEIGFNAGHSTALMLLANPQSKILHFDLNAHAYCGACYKYLKTVFGSERFIDFIPGDSTQTLPSYQTHLKFDLIHIDGGHTDPILLSDIESCRKLHTPQHVVVIDDYNAENIKAVTDKKVSEGVLAPFTGIISQYQSELYHFIGHYTE